ADPQGRAHVELLGIAHDGFELRELLDDQDDLLADFAGQDGHLDEFVILEAVADNGRCLAIGMRQDRQKFRLGTGLQSEIEGPADVENLLDHVSLLVHLDRVDAAIAALVVEFIDGGLEGIVDLAHALPQDIREAEEDGELDAAGLQLIDQALQVDRLGWNFVRMDTDVAFVIEAKVDLSRKPDAVHFNGILDFPFLDEIHQLTPRRG